MESTEPNTEVKPSTSRMIIGALTFVWYALLLDLAIETFWSGSPVRWWVAGTVGTYLAVCGFVRWREKAGQPSFGWLVGPTASLLVLLGLLAVTAWLPEGSTRGVVMLGQPTNIVLSAVTAAAIGLAGFTLIRSRFVPSAGKWMVGVLTGYGIAACLAGIISGTPYSALFQGESLWRRLPLVLQGAVLGSLVVLPLGLAVHIAALVQRTPIRWRFRQIVAPAMSLVIVASGMMAPAGQPLASIVSLLRPLPDRKVVSAEIEKIRAATAPQNLSAGLDALDKLPLEPLRPTFDVQAKARQLGPDVNRIFAFVRDDVKYEVYEGVLRGDRGALMAEAGNAFDKSILLGSLLRLNGVEVRFVRGRLSRDRAERLVAAMFKTAGETRRPAWTALPQVEQQMKTFPMQLGTAADSLTSVSDARWRTNLNLLGNAVKQAGQQVADAPPVSREMLLDEAANHLWVEYREGTRWIPLDASFEGAKPGETFTTASNGAGDIPAALAHKVTIRVRVEERETDKRATRDVLRHEITAAELNGAFVTLAFQLAPSGNVWSATPVLQIQDNSISGEPFPSGSGGTQSSLAGYGQGIGRMTDFLSGSAEKAKGVREVVAVWLEFDFISPSGQIETVRREVFDRIALSARLQNRDASAPLAPLALRSGVPLALAGLFACSFSSGRLPASLPVSRLSQHRMALRSISHLVSSNREPTEDEARQLSAVLRPILPALLSAAATSMHAFSQERRSLLRGKGLAFYEATPRLAISSLELTGSEDGKTVANAMTVDLRRNNVRVVSEGLQGSQVVWASIARGVLDGSIEHTLFINGSARLSTRQSSSAGSAVAVMEQADATGTDVRVVDTAEEIEDVQVSETTKARMLQSLSEGVALVAPQHAVALQGREQFGWWRVDLRSGETLAVMENGLHGFVEYLEIAGLVLGGMAIGFGLCGLAVIAVLMIYTAGFKAGVESTKPDVEPIP